MRFITAAATALAFAGAATAAALQPRATTYKITVDTTVCNDELNAKVKPAITGTGAHAGTDFTDPTALDGLGWSEIRPGDKIFWQFEVPADYTGHVWLYDTTKAVPKDGLSVYGLDIEVYNSPTNDKPNKATLKALGDAYENQQPAPLKTAWFASQLWGQITDSVNSYSGGFVGSTVVGDGISLGYC
ncbi:hypothetical protein MPH_07520 [Macrophomina phaseolina MS6]|uniref:Uncharacterized protein n=1 Tax=Macrophomina phaseolina (strain MS6) TaxID=1126212 RepID=K2SEK6_MACPH|nr:hypothetical protein MPH_07520 [Macrophomina phaseolina MS6]